MYTLNVAVMKLWKISTRKVHEEIASYTTTPLGTYKIIEK
jgi:ribosomal protein S17E